MEKVEKKTGTLITEKYMEKGGQNKNYTGKKKIKTSARMRVELNSNTRGHISGSLRNVQLLPTQKHTTAGSKLFSTCMKTHILRFQA